MQGSFHEMHENSLRLGTWVLSYTWTITCLTSFKARV
jgi:hypothetical protein